MRSHQDHYIHQLTVKTITTILKNGAWQAENQSITSAITNDNDLEKPNDHLRAIGENTAGTNAFSDVEFDHKVKRILDVGGGKYDSNRNYLKRERNIDLAVWDPYNRSSAHNNRVEKEVTSNPVDAVTSMSVLNVIPETEVRLAHISTLKAALILGGKAYFKIWPGEYPLQGSYLPAATEAYYQANAYADRFLREIELVFGRGQVKLDTRIPNLIIAVKSSEAQTSESGIILIQNASKKDLEKLSLIRERSIRLLYSRTNIFKLFSTNLSFFKKFETQFIEENRHSDSKIQREYDKARGLVLYNRR